MQNQPPSAPLKSLRVRRWQHGQWTYIEEVASQEERVSIDFGNGHCQLWACPQHLESLALGHVILDQCHDDLDDAPSPLGLRKGSAELLPDADNCVAVEHKLSVTLMPRENAIPDFQDCGKATATHLSQCMKNALTIPGLWDGTGCFHRAALVYLPMGEIRLWTEDIGRHNCLDRLAGLCSLQGLAPEEHALFISARITASLYRKARRAGFSFIVSRAAVTSEPLERALAQGVTLVGYCRTHDQRLTVFADGMGRITPE